MIESHDYVLRLDATGPKTGTIGAPQDHLPELDVASPPEFGGPENVWSPEHFFVAAISSCLMTTFHAIAAASQLEVVSYSDDPVGHLIRADDRMYRFDRVTLRPRVVIADADKVDKARRLLDKAGHACLVSRSVSSEIHLEPVIEVAARV